MQVLLMAVNAVRYALDGSTWLSSGHWTDMFLLQPGAALLPLASLLLPPAWLLLNAFGMAWILALFYTTRQCKVPVSTGFYLVFFCFFRLWRIRVGQDSCLGPSLQSS